MGLRALEVGWDGIGCGWRGGDGDEDEGVLGFGAMTTMGLCPCDGIRA
jgi:hypothetical protein